MHIAHLGATHAERLAAGGLHALDQPRIGRKLLHAVKARDVVNLVQDRQGENLPDARDRSQTVERIGIVAFGLSNNREFEVHDEGVVLVDERQVDIDTLSHTRIREMRAHAVAVGGIREAPLESREIVLGAGILNVRQKLAALK